MGPKLYGHIPQLVLPQTGIPDSLFPGDFVHVPAGKIEGPGGFASDLERPDVSSNPR